ncbi:MULTISPECIES: DedA family protein [unclassified Arthrobacter]|uniref:DedA family protein n=1 Tax=unclassified Arthrobacter TaxID=235627 RepID=UPI0024DF3444|nr:MULTISPECIES: DedA family protein [unclassified Arthrobacter]MCC9146067.1 DedA family protein [Arthrobacter sp. zg-Y919]MDK1277296.1 DedA family protein [Arthrobacter sp. zg.Y919]WIB04490.1 DedA family protein [Arthrobacter sp. zg-Y919]
MDGINNFILASAGSPWVYIGLFACCLIDGFFPPVPSESLVVALASLALSGAGVNVWLIIPAAALGAFVGDNLAYLMGRGIGIERFAWMRRPKLQRSIAWARHELDKRSVSLILVARFIPVGRVVVNVTAGATGFPQRRFIALTGISGIVWAAYSVAIGSIAGAWFNEHHLLGVVVGVSGALVLGLIVDRLITMVRGTVPETQHQVPDDMPKADDGESSQKAA